MPFDTESGTAESFAVRFSETGFWGALSSKPEPPWKLVGAGTLRVADHQLLISGLKSVFPFVRRRSELAFALDTIQDVHQNGSAVSFAVRPTTGKPTRLNLWAADEDAARHLTTQLPSEQSQGFKKQLQDNDEFSRSLQAVGARSVATAVLVAINVLAFIATTLGGGGFFKPNGEAMLRFGTNYGPLTADGQWWRLFTSTFLHFGFIHLLLNMWALASLGQLTERLYGTGRYVLLYVFAGVTGSLASFYWHPNINSAGASGAIFGVIGALLAFMVNPRTTIPASIAAAQRNSALVFIAYNLANGMAHRGIDNAAHIGGLIGGFAIGWLLARPLTAQARERTTAGFAAIVLGALAVLLAAAWPLINPSSERRADVAFRRQMDSYFDAEDRAVQTTQSLGKQLDSNALTRMEWGDKLEREALPQWRNAQSLVENSATPSRADLSRLRVALLHYLDLQTKMLKKAARSAQRDSEDGTDLDELVKQRDAALSDAQAAMKQIE